MRHRGKHPEDDLQFAVSQIPSLRDAVEDMSHLLSRSYAEPAALKLVGDHYQLTSRQRRAVLGASCSDQALASRLDRFVIPRRIRGASLVADGYNILINAETVLSGGYVFRGRDGCLRDLASVHGSYRRVEETVDAIQVLGDCLGNLGAATVRWLFDAPVSNSGRLRGLMQEMADASAWPWDVELDAHVDRALAASSDIVLSSDSWILDRAARWTSIGEVLLHRCGAEGGVVDLNLPVKLAQTEPNDNAR